ncbi:MAG: CBS domain-containing protein, partial [Pseudomonadales bacterium]
IVAEDNSLLGIFTDGDLRRVVDQKIDITSATMADVMSANPKTISSSILAAEALSIMENATITALIVEDENHHPIGVLHMHDILRAGVV